MEEMRNGNEKMKSVKKKKGTSRIYTRISTAICLILCTDIWFILQVLYTMHLHMQSNFSSHVSSHALILHLCMSQASKYFCILSTCTFFSRQNWFEIKTISTHYAPFSFFLSFSFFFNNNEHFCVSMWSKSTWITWGNKSLSGDLKTFVWAAMACSHKSVLPGGF